MKPKVSPLTAGDVQALELEFMTAPSGFVEHVVAEWLNEPGDPNKILADHQWRTYAMKVVRGAWRDKLRRSEVIAAIAPPSEHIDETGGYGAVEDWA